METKQRTKLQRILNKLDGKSEATAKVIADFDAGAKALRDKLEQDITAATLDEVNRKINGLRKSVNINPLLKGVENLQSEFKQHALETLKEIEDRTAELRAMIKEKEDAMTKRIEPLVTDNKNLKAEIGNLVKASSENLLKVRGDISMLSQKLPSFADKKTVEDKLQELEDRDNTEELKDYTDKTRIELLNKLAEKGGGNMNRQITVANVDPLKKYTDINFVAGSNMTITTSVNEVTKRVNFTFASSGGGGSVIGTSRQIQTTTVSSVIAGLSGIDQVTLANGGVAITLPTAVGDIQLYTIKNVGVSSVAVLTTGGETIDGQPNIIMPVQFTSVDLISDSANWNIT